MNTRIVQLMGGLFFICFASAAAPAQSTTGSKILQPCADLPTAPLSEADLIALVPTRSPGRVRVAWSTESQENTYGFYILRSDKLGGPYIEVNQTIIPGEGTTSIPMSYCFEDTGVRRGQVYFYQIVEITNAGKRSIIPGTADTKVEVKTVDEEREWLKKKADSGGRS